MHIAMVDFKTALLMKSFIFWVLFSFKYAPIDKRHMVSRGHNELNVYYANRTLYEPIILISEKIQVFFQV